MSEDRCPPGWCRSQEIAFLRAALTEVERERDAARDDRLRYRCQVDALKQLGIAAQEAWEKKLERVEAILIDARKVISGIVNRWDAETDREGNERYSGMALWEDMEPEMKNARTFLEHQSTAPGEN